MARTSKKNANAVTIATADAVVDAEIRDVAETAADAVAALPAPEAAAEAAPVEAAVAAIVARSPFVRWLVSPFNPRADETAIELPYRLITSPVGAAQFAHRTTPHERRGRTELWHTRATSDPHPEDHGADSPVDLRAIWSDDYSIPSETLNTILTRISAADPRDAFFRSSLDPLDRAMMVPRTAGFDEKRSTGASYLPRPARANRLVLSSLGGLLDSEGNWRVRPATADIEQWRHLATLGRDHYVRVVYAGYLWPFGHAASLVKVTERKFEDAAPDRTHAKRIAVLRQRFFVVVRERVKAFTGARHVHGGRTFPFTEVELLTTVTPNLIDPGSAPCHLLPLAQVYGANDELPRRMVFWPRSGTGDAGLFRFQAASTDLAGTRHTFDLPMLFVGEIANGHATRAPGIREAYNGSAHATRRETSPLGTSVCFAPVDTNAKGDTRLPTTVIRFNAGKVTSVEPALVNVYPEIEQATVGIQAVQRLLARPSRSSSIRARTATTGSSATIAARRS